jgi:hypothetical protein
MASRKKPPTGRFLYSSYLSNCRRRNVFWGLSLEEFVKITSQNCVYCGRKPSQVRGTYTYNGIDRKDNDRGYTVKNSLPCCKTCNSVKSDRFTFEQMKKIGRVLQIINKAGKPIARKR